MNNWNIKKIEQIESLKSIKLINRYIAVAGVLLLMGLCLLSVPQASADYVVDRDKPEWFKESFLDFEEDVAEAAEEGKRLMIYFGQDGCPYCEKLHQTSFRQADLLHTIQKNFDSIGVNIFGDIDTVWVDGNDYTEKELANHLGIQFTPSLMFLDEDGNEVLRLAGYQPPKKLAIALRYVAELTENKEGKMEFVDYLRQEMADNQKQPIGHQLPAEFVQPPYSFSSLQKRTAVFVIQNDCPFCEEWQSYLLEAPDAQQFDIVRLDMFGRKSTLEDNVLEKDWVRKHNVSFAPALIFFDTTGEEIFRVDGYLRSFHLSSVLDYVGSDAYKTEPEFQRFLQARADRIREEGGEVTIW